MLASLSEHAMRWEEIIKKNICDNLPYDISDEVGMKDVGSRMKIFHTIQINRQSRSIWLSSNQDRKREEKKVDTTAVLIIIYFVSIQFSSGICNSRLCSFRI